jgi:hypothetical protein
VVRRITDQHRTAGRALSHLSNHEDRSARFKCVACRYDPASGRHAFETIATNPPAVHDLLIDARPSRLVIEACSVCGWISDLAESLAIEVVVANTLGEAWKWKKVKRKTDRDDALKLAKLAATDQLPLVHLPKLQVRQQRALIKYRHALIDRRTGIKNTIRSLLDAQGLSLPGRSRGPRCNDRAGMAQARERPDWADQADAQVGGKSGAHSAKCLSRRPRGSGFVLRRVQCTRVACREAGARASDRRRAATYVVSGRGDDQAAVARGERAARDPRQPSSSRL